MISVALLKQMGLILCFEGKTAQTLEERVRASEFVYLTSLLNSLGLMSDGPVAGLKERT